jgi:hypothetical protein
MSNIISQNAVHRTPDKTLGAHRIYREAVKNHSPGLQAWGGHTRGKRPERATDVGIHRQTA